MRGGKVDNKEQRSVSVTYTYVYQVGGRGGTGRDAAVCKLLKLYVTNVTLN